MLWLSLDEWSCSLELTVLQIEKKWAAETFSDYIARVQSLLHKHQNECSGIFTDHFEKV